MGMKKDQRVLCPVSSPFKRRPGIHRPLSSMLSSQLRMRRVGSRKAQGSKGAKSNHQQGLFHGRGSNEAGAKAGIIQEDAIKTTDLSQKRMKGTERGSFSFVAFSVSFVTSCKKVRD